MFSEELLSAMTDADLFMVNEEFPFSTRGEAAEDKQFTFRVDPSYVRIFQEIGCGWMPPLPTTTRWISA